MKASAKRFALISAITLWRVGTGLVYGQSTLLWSYDGISVPPIINGTDYPTYYVGNNEGGTFTRSVDSANKVSGSASLKMEVTSGWGLYAQFNPYNVTTGRGFARQYSQNPAQWQFNTFNRMRFWFWHASNGSKESTDGTQNFYVGTYVKSVVQNDTSSDESGGGHYYHPFNVVPGLWNMCILNSHPGHERGDPGAIDSGNRPYPTTAPWGSGDPAGTYNYFDTLTRWYISGDDIGAPFPRVYRLDDIQFYRESRPENDDQVYSVCVARDPSVNRIFISWNRPKDENSVNHEVRYAFSDIHGIGWNNALVAPNGVITPPGWQGYNGMVYDTTAISLGSASMLYIAIKPQNSSVFSQVAFPLVSSSGITSPLAPAGLGVVVGP